MTEPERRPGGHPIYLAPTWDQGEPSLSTLRHIAKEGRVYVVGCCMALRRDDIPDGFEFKRLYPPGRVWVNTGGSAIVDPDGRTIAGPLALGGAATQQVALPTGRTSKTKRVSKARKR